MAKGTFLDDTFEQLVELGKSTVKATGQAMKQTFSPLKLLDQAVGKQSNDKGIEQTEKGQSKKQNHTPLDFEKLQNKYKDQDKMKTEALRNRLFQLVKSGEEKAIYEKKREEEEKKRKLFYEEQEKRRREEERRRQEQAAVAPQGKQRRNIFSHKKVAERQQAEVKPSSGKQ